MKKSTLVQTTVFLLSAMAVMAASETRNNDTRQQEILNSEINVGDAAHVRLREGVFQRGQSAMNDADFLQARIVSTVAFGDLKGDGENDAVAVLGTSAGGSGFFPELHVFVGGKQGEFVDTA